MSSDEENDDVLQDLEEIRDKMMNTPRNERMQVSAWEDDDDGVEAERNAKEPDEKAMLSAAEEGNLEKVKTLLSKNRLLLKCTDKDGYTPLHRACYADNVKVVEYLLEMGARLDAKTQDEWQPLHSACCWNNVECALTLISCGADVNARSKGDQTPLHLLCASSHNSPALQLFLLHPDTDFSILNSSGDTAAMIARRTTKFYPIFEITEPCLNEI
ncbi:ankyrin repeat domain-containing protein 49-like [Pseudomyrmex gracilis]|uniref:ankyrin repeat domain-containing protein 49-like n=1 Tax=Pseudomyrmex gracilis TaxID=219809 RepID=UPI000994D003|nr:ankyrin repeat domain-containing protein 49-like [Pseudomyrmex gracilis]